MNGGVVGRVMSEGYSRVVSWGNRFGTWSRINKYVRVHLLKRSLFLPSYLLNALYYQGDHLH